MTHQPPAWPACPEDISSASGYTFSEAADYLAIRHDDLVALLPDTAIVVETWDAPRLTAADIALLERLICRIKEFAAESAYGGGDL